MNCMFDNKTLISLPDFKEINTSKVTDINSLFSYCESLISLPDIENWDTSKLTIFHIFLIFVNP